MTKDQKIIRAKAGLLELVKPIFNSPVCEVAERQRQSAPCWRLGTTYSDLA